MSSLSLIFKPLGLQLMTCIDPESNLGEPGVLLYVLVRNDTAHHLGEGTFVFPEEKVGHFLLSNLDHSADIVKPPISRHLGNRKSF